MTAQGLKIARLCDDDWLLPSQLSTLQRWLAQNSGKLAKGTLYLILYFRLGPTQLAKAELFHYR
jgi:hypothetical protein